MKKGIEMAEASFETMSKHMQLTPLLLLTTGCGSAGSRNEQANRRANTNTPVSSLVKKFHSS
jgi:hypothetical protein